MYRWLARLTAARARHPEPRRPTRPGLEALETRCVPTTVTNLGDAGAGSLRQEIANTAAGGTVDFAPGLTGTITLTSGEIVINKNLTISGPGAGLLSVSGNNNSRIFDITSGANVSVGISGLTLTGGNGTGGGNLGGGAIRIDQNETVSISNTVVTGNTSSGDDGGGLLGRSGSILSVTDSTFSNNIVTGNVNDGGGLSFQFGANATIESCTITGNSTEDAGGGIELGFGSLTISDSTISNNTSGRRGGGIACDTTKGNLTVVRSTISGNTTTTNLVGGDGGGGIFGVGIKATILDCTITGNQTINAAVGGSGGGGDGGGIDIDGGIDFFNPGSWTIRSSTIAFNSAAGKGGGIVTRGSAFPDVTLQSSIVADNTSAGSPSDLVNLTGTISGDHDLIRATPAANTIAINKGGNLFGVDPLLAPLASNGGLTQTHALKAGSPAIDKGSNPANLDTDQRGAPFGRVAGSAADIGAFEVQTTTTNLLTDNTTLSASGADQTFTLSASVSGSAGTVNEGQVIFTVRLGGMVIGTPVAGTVSNGVSSAVFTLPANTAAGAYTVTAAYVDNAASPLFAASNGNGTLTVKAASTPAPSPEPGPGPGPMGSNTPGIFAVGSGAGGLPLIDVYDAQTGAFKLQFQAFETGFTGGVRVAVGRLNGQDVIIAAAGPGGFPLVRVFTASGAPISQFEAFGHGFAGGVWVAAGDLNGDGGLEIVTGPDAASNSSPFITIHDVTGKQIGGNVPVFEEGFHGGVRVAIEDLNGDGKPEIVASAGPGGLPLVQVINGQTLQRGMRFGVFDPTFSGGLFVTGAVLDASGLGRIVVAADGGDGKATDEPVVREYDAAGTLLHGDVMALDASYHGGVDVKAVRGFGRSFDSLLVGPVRAHTPSVTVLDENLNAQSSQGFNVLDPKTKALDAVFANGLYLG
jgi:hypothetical protein